MFKNILIALLFIKFAIAMYVIQDKNLTIKDLRDSNNVILSSVSLANSTVTEEHKTVIARLKREIVKKKLYIEVLLPRNNPVLRAKYENNIKKLIKERNIKYGIK